MKRRRPHQRPPGALYRAEILEQPQALRRLAAQEGEIAAVARSISARDPTVIRLVGHGSSDNAASFGVYAFGLLSGWTALRDSISLSVYYHARLDLSRSVVVALSQSGRTPDVIEYVARSRRQGALTLAITNDLGSDLAEIADAVVPLAAGPERAIAATKTYVNQVAALALLAGACAGRGAELAGACNRTADLMEATLHRLQRTAAEVAGSISFVERMYVLGRGIELTTAREVALKLTETCRVAADALTGTDLAHGPIAALDPHFPVWAIASHDEALPMAQEAAARAREAGATVVASGNAADAIDGAAFKLSVPAAPTPLFAPLLSVVPGQLFAAALAEKKGLDPDRPARLSKVTFAQ